MVSSSEDHRPPYSMDLDDTELVVYPMSAESPHGRSHEEIKYICGFSEDDGNTVECERCDTWQHIACYYESAQHVSDVHECRDCEPRPVPVPAFSESGVQLSGFNIPFLDPAIASTARLAPTKDFHPGQRASIHGGFARPTKDERRNDCRTVDMIGRRPGRCHKGMVRYTISQDDTVCKGQLRRGHLVAL